MEFGIFNLMGSREADKPTAQVFGEAGRWGQVLPFARDVGGNEENL